MSEETKSSVMPIAVGGAVAVLAAVAIFLMQSGPEELEEAPEVAATESVSGAPAAEAAEEEPATETATEEPATPEDAPETVAEAPEEPAPPAGPTFDTFRVEPDGSMVIAGRAEPGQTVDIMLGGEALERVTADASGAFVALPIASPSDAPRRLTLVADPDGTAIEGDTSYIVAPIAAPVVVAAAPEPEAAPEPAPVEEVSEPVIAEADDGAETIETETVAEPQVAEAPVAPPAPPTVIESSEDGVRVVQGAQAEEADNVALDAITYDPEGEVQLSGRATGEGSVQVYLDNEPILTTPVEEGGDWRADLPEVDTGVYTLRIDEVDGEGDVVSRLETPFKREEPEDVAAVLAEETAQEGFEVAVRTVQPGATLWAIAEERYGNGILYVEVFEANADLIRDPDLIYPGQIFRMPELDQ